MMDFLIDTKGDVETLEQSKEGKTLVSQLLQEYKESLSEEVSDSSRNPKQAKDVFEEFYEKMGWNGSKNRRIESTVLTSSSSTIDIEPVLKKSVITDSFEQLQCIPPLEISEKKQKLQRQMLAQCSKGKKWYGLPATEMTDEIKRDLEILQMRSVLDPKRFYKKNDLKVLPKYFQVGKVMPSALDYYNNRLTKKQQKRTLVDELLADEEFNKYNKRKYKEIIEDKAKTHYKAWRKAKKLKKKNK